MIECINGEISMKGKGEELCSDLTCIVLALLTECNMPESLLMKSVALGIAFYREHSDSPESPRDRLKNTIREVANSEHGNEIISDIVQMIREAVEE